MLHEGDAGNPVDRTLEYSRPFRSLRLWLALRVHGAAQFRAWIERTLAQRRAAGRTPSRAHPAFELLHEPMLSTVCFRHVPAGMPRTGSTPTTSGWRAPCSATGAIYLAPAVGGRAHLPARVLRQLPDHARCGGARARGRRGAGCIARREVTRWLLLSRLSCNLRVTQRPMERPT